MALQEPFRGWLPDPVLDEGEQLALKYCGYCPASRSVTGEYQIVPMLTGLFWDVEHSAIYKPSPELRGVAGRMAQPGASPPQVAPRPASWSLLGFVANSVTTCQMTFSIGPAHPRKLCLARNAPRQRPTERRLRSIV